MIELLLKASFAIGVALLFYKLLLQQESFFAANRLYLVGCLALAFALPFVTLPKLVNHQGYLTTLIDKETFSTKDLLVSETEHSEVLADKKELPAEQTQTQTAQVPQQNLELLKSDDAQVQVTGETDVSIGFSWTFWLSTLYLFGVVIFALSFLFQVGSIYYKVFTATDKIQDGSSVIVNTSSRQAPCSFFKYIFIYPDDYGFETYEQIIAHEKIHARLGHSFDLLLAEIAVIILWFNPIIWLFKREVEKNLEYQTDAVLLEKEQVSKKKYQLNLLHIAVPNKPLSITTNYNQSLLKQRIMMMNTKKSLPHAYWKYAFLAPLFFGTLLLLNEPATSQSNYYAAPMSEVASGKSNGGESSQVPKETIAERIASSLSQVKKEQLSEKQSEADQEVQKRAIGPEKGSIGPKKGYTNLTIKGQADMSEGYWYGSKENGEYCIQFKGSKSSSSWNMSRCFAANSFQKKGNDVYVMTREAGTLELSGNLDADVSQGKYKFTEDASFKKYLASNNITSKDQNLMFHLFFAGVDKAYVGFLKKNYSDVSGDRLLELAIHGVNQKDFQEYIALFQKYSNKKPSIQEVVEARIHGIDQQYVQEVQAMGYKDLSLKKMMEAKIHGVNAAYVEELRKAGFSNLSMDKVIAAKIHGVDAEAVKEIQALGYGKLDLDKIMELKIHGVNAAFVKELRSAGYSDLTLDQVVAAKIHGLDAASIKEIKALGFKNLDFEDLMTAQIHGVDAAYVKDLKKAGFSNLSLDDVVAAKIHGIDSDFISKARKDGYNLNSIDNYVSLKIHGMAIESLKEKEKDKDKMDKNKKDKNNRRFSLSPVVGAK